MLQSPFRVETKLDSVVWSNWMLRVFDPSSNLESVVFASCGLIVPNWSFASLILINSSWGFVEEKEVVIDTNLIFFFKALCFSIITFN